MTDERPFPAGRTLVYPIIGHPTVQVKAPTTFNRYFNEKHIDAVMIAIDVHPREVAHFFSFLRGWQNCPGCVITVPHKQEAAQQADELSPRARNLGAINVIRRTDQGRLVGDMVDGLGFLEALRLNNFDVRGKRAVVFGAGGAGSAVACAIAETGAKELVIIDSDSGRQQHILELIALRYPLTICSNSLSSLAGFDLVINATPLGMSGDQNMPYPLTSLHPGVFVADVVATPEMTPWLQEAKARGCRIQTGYEMFLGEFSILRRHMGIAF